ncbi:MAG: flagellin [Planctomycetaceae bacterium]|nr:flagellin [Planctomycetaceae bacterium]
MTRINSNVASLVAQNRLQSSNKDLGLALTRLSTGLRINSGSDDPAGLIASEALRSEITGLNKAISNTKRASQIITTADSALGQVSSLLNDIRGLVVEAANNGALSDEEVAANQLQIDSSLSAINRISKTTTFQGQKLLDGSLDYVSDVGSVSSVQDASITRAKVGASALNVEVIVSSVATQGSITAASTGFTTAAQANVSFGNGTESIDVTAAASGSDFNDVQINFVDDTSAGNVAASAAYDSTQKVITVTYNSTASTATNKDFNSVVTAINSLTDFGAALGGGTGTVAFTEPTADVSTAKTGGEVLADDLVFELSGTEGAETFNFGSGTSKSQIAAAVNLVSDSTGVGAAVSSGALVLSSTTYGGEAVAAIDVISEGSSGLFGANLDSNRASGTDIVASVNGVQASGSGNELSINTSSLALSLTVDGSGSNFSFSISGGGASFQLGPQVTSSQQASLGISSVSTGQLGGTNGRLYELGSGQTKSLTNDVQGASNVIDDVISKVTALRGRLGAFQATTLDSNLVSLNETSANLQEAESSIRDADFAQESARLTRAQILVQSGTNVLALANQNPQNVLALLR